MLLLIALLVGGELYIYSHMNEVLFGLQAAKLLWLVSLCTGGSPDRASISLLLTLEQLLRH